MSAKDKINILAVDDNPAKLLTYEASLREFDEELILVTSAEEALRDLLKTDVAIMLLDVHMPEIDGFELAAMIREHPRFHRMSSFRRSIRMTSTDLKDMNGVQSITSRFRLCRNYCARRLACSLNCSGKRDRWTG